MSGAGWLEHSEIESAVGLCALALQNRKFRHTIYALSNAQLQVTVMSVQQRRDGGRIARELHRDATQLLMTVDGEGELLLGERGERSVPLQHGIVAMVPPNTWHEVRNKGATPLQLISFYVPPQHTSAAEQEQEAAQ